MLPAGIEPATFRLGGERSIQLSYGSKILLSQKGALISNSKNEFLAAGKLKYQRYKSVDAGIVDADDLTCQENVRSEKCFIKVSFFVLKREHSEHIN